jgi:catechol 2,3-dioxygenase-like lactoylglutathione lyase family enzyme
VSLTGVRHAALPARDLDRAIRFYTEALGFAPYYTGDADWAMLSLAGTSLSLIRSGAGPAAATSQGVHPAHLGITASSAAEVDVCHGRVKSHS